MPYTTAITISNRSAAAIEVWIEPWGDFVPVASGSAVRVIADAERAGEFEVEHGAEGAVIVWAWPSSTVRCYVGTEETKLGAFSVPVPNVPPGMTTFGFLRFVLGQDE